MTKYRSVHNECNKAEQEHFSQKKIQVENVFSTKLKSTCKNSGTFEGQKNFIRKGHLGQSCTKSFICFGPEKSHQGSGWLGLFSSFIP